MKHIPDNDTTPSMSSEDTSPIEGYDYEQKLVSDALRRRNASAPDVELMWQRFVTDHNIDAVATPTPVPVPWYRKMMWAACGAVAGIALVVVAVFVLKLQSVPEGPVIIYSAANINDDIRMASTYIDKDDKPVMTAPSKPQISESEAQTVTIDDDVLDMRNVPATAGEQRIVTTPAGKRLTIILADNSRVILNPESSLRFPVRFDSDDRTLYLDGEALFEVAKDPEHPFNVISQNICTTALGTEFDVKAYDRADLCVSLLSGSVRVTDLTDNDSVVLVPGQDAKCTDGNLVVSNTDLKAFEYWKEGFFYFDNVPLVDVMVELGRWHNVSIELKNRALMSYRLHFVADRNESVSDIIERLNHFNYLSAHYDGNKIVIEEKK